MDGDDAMGIRNRLKVAQTKTVHQDSPVHFSKATLKLSPENLHMSLLIVVTEAPTLLEKLSIGALQLLLSSYCSEQEYASLDPAFTKKSGVDKIVLADAVAKTIQSKRTAGFSRHEPEKFACRLKSK